MMRAYASGGSGKNGVNGKAANGQSLRRKKGESQAQYYARTGESILGATSKTKGRPATIKKVPQRRG